MPDGNGHQLMFDDPSKWMADVKGLVTACFGSRGNPTMLQFMQIVQKLQFDEKPDYGKLRKILMEGIVSSGAKFDGKITAGDGARGKPRKRTSDENVAQEPPSKPAN